MLEDEQSEAGEQGFGERRTRPHRLSQRKLHRDNTGENIVFDTRGRLSVRKSKDVTPPGVIQAGLLSSYEEAGATAALNAAQHNVALEAHNSLLLDVAELRRTITDMRASFKAAKLME